jgi:D-alanine-D-alanine ligase
MEKRKIQAAILYGGKSGEHEVSLISAASVYKHIDRNRFDVILIGIDRDGRWYLQKDPQWNSDAKALAISREPSMLLFSVPGEGLRTAESTLDIDVVFPVLHGTFGEDGTVQGLLELCNLPYAGAGVLGSSLCMDKAAVKRIWMQADLPVVPFFELREVNWLRSGMETASVKKTLETFPFPLFVKPSRAGSSVGVSRCTDRAGLKQCIETAFRFDDKLLMEPAVVGQEVECSVIGNQEIRSFTPGEIVPSHDFYDYEAKYIDPVGAELLIPANLSGAQEKALRQICSRAYRLSEVEGFARVDCFVEKGSGKILLNEINTIPGFTSISMFPRMCNAGGLSYPELLTTLLDLAIDRHRKRSEKSYQWS